MGKIMYQRIILPLIIIFFTSIYLSAQNTGIYVPPQFQKIYSGDTRSWEGKPGAGYWQNSSDYNLKVKFDPEANLISGKEKVIYYNNSPDALENIVIRLYQDFYKKGIARDWGWGEIDLHNGTDIKKLVINGEELDPDTAGRRTYTNFIIKLPEVLSPKSNLNLEIEWSVTLPDTVTIRMGKYREGGIMVSYWYPQIAVYDDIDGWDLTEYTGSVEFYNDFNNYDVEITVPENYLVRGTGEMLNGDEILNEDIYNRYLTAFNSDTVVRIITPDDLEEGNITKEDWNTWKYKANNVTDFTFACVKDYLWDGVSVVADSVTGRRTFADVLYRKGDNYFIEGAEFSKMIVESLSYHLPGVPFPYSHITSFCNGERGGGMESPMMTDDGAPGTRAGTYELLYHEISHTYFPFYMGINESKYGWMDEGWATFFPKDFPSQIDSTYNHYTSTYWRYRPVMGEENDLPLMIPSKFIKGYSLTATIYGRAFFAYVALQSLLGEKLFKKALIEFINRWHGKHPLPYDFFFTFNDVAKEDLSWFWKPWFYDFSYCDLGLEKNDAGRLVVKLVGTQPVPVEVLISYYDGTKDTVNESTGIWRNGKRGFVVPVNDQKKILSAEIITDKIPDYDPSNNLLFFNRGSIHK